MLRADTIAVVELGEQRVGASIGWARRLAVAEECDDNDAVVFKGA